MKTRTPSPRSAGWTLATLLLAVALTAPSCHARPAPFELHSAKAVCSQVHLEMLADALELFQVTYGFFPPTRAGLGALMQPVFGQLPILPHDASLVQDCWGHRIHYLSPAAQSGERFELWSAGPDGTSGTSDDIAITPPDSPRPLNDI